MPGTFVLTFASVSSTSGDFTAFNTSVAPGACSTTNAALLEGTLTNGAGFLSTGRMCNAGDAFTGESLIRFLALQTDAVWSLDGGALQTYLSLPAGFIVSNIIMTAQKGSGTTYYGNATEHVYMQYDALTEQEILNGSVSGGAIGSFTYPNPITALNLLLNGAGIRYTMAVPDPLKLKFLKITGNWDLAYTITSILPNPAKAGDVVTITGTQLNNIPLIPNPTIQYNDAGGTLRTVTITNATLVDNQHITFTVPPPTLPSGADPAYYDGNGTMFSGTVPLGTITFYNGSGSGIYKFVANQRHDILYNRNGGGTTNVAIPTPFGETGFIGG